MGVDVHAFNHTLTTMIPIIRTGIPLFSVSLKQTRFKPSEFSMNDPRDHVILVATTGEAWHAMASLNTQMSFPTSMGFGRNA